MARYRKIDPRIWNDEKFASLSHEGQRAFLFILTHPSMTSLGAFRATKEGIEAELGIDTKGFAKPFQELLSKGLIKYDESCFLVFAPNFLKYNQPENPNVVKGWAGCLDLLPECPLLAEVLQRAKSCASANSKTSKAFSESLGRVTETLSERYAKQLSKGLAIQEQEQEQEYKDVSDETSSSDSPALTLDGESDVPKRAPSVPLQKIVDTYNSKLGSQLGMCRQLNKQRQGNLRQRWADISRIVESNDPKEVLEGFAAFYDKIGRSNFLMGRAADFKATFDWIHNSTNFLKIYEGNYENGRKR